ncbi:hypothetical protein Bra471DRAFT_05382 [Bradyrhizobium sp. WSM471]|nr:hypothetical protein Bra471DRAFT_05382 [Bradyrhizobium sp. WSM471]
MGYRNVTPGTLPMFKFCKQKTKSSIHPGGSVSRLQQGLATKSLHPRWGFFVDRSILFVQSYKR